MPKPAHTNTHTPAIPHPTQPSSGPADDFLQSALAHARHGDQDALTYLYIRYADDVAREIQTHTGNTTTTQTLTEQLFAELQTTLPPNQTNNEATHFHTWILHHARQTPTPPTNAS